MCIFRTRALPLLSLLRALGFACRNNVLRADGDRKRAPERRRPTKETLTAAVRYACHQPKYRCNLRHEVAVQEYLDAAQLNAILAACAIDKSMSLEADAARGMIHRYLQYHEAEDEEWIRRRNVSKTSE